MRICSSTSQRQSNSSKMDSRREVASLCTGKRSHHVQFLFSSLEFFGTVKHQERWHGTPLNLASAKCMTFRFISHSD